MRRGLPLAALVLIAVLASRAPFAARELWAHDSVLYANAMERGFHVDDDPVRQRPHPPGYLFYVLSADVARAGGLESNDALVLVSAMASALTAAALFLFARRWVSDAVALVAAAAYAADPLVWQYSDIAYPYTVLGLGSILVAAACLWSRGRGWRAAVVASVVFGLAAGFRQDLLVLLFPLWLWSVAPLGRRGRLVAAASLGVASLAWAVPTVILSDGLVDYLSAALSQAAYVRQSYSVTDQGLPALVRNLAATSWALGWGLLTMAPLAIAAITAIAVRTWRRRPSDDGSFVLLWTLPPLAVYVFLHIGDWGYVLSALPGLYVLGARVLGTAVTRTGRARRVPAFGAAWVGLVLVPAYLFIAAPLPFSAGAIAQHDHELAVHISYVRANYPARSTLILTREDHLLVRYYLPEYRARQYDPEPYAHSARRMRAGRVERVLVFTAGLVPERAIDVRRVQCTKDVELVYIDVAPGSVLEFRGERYAIAAPAF